MGQNQAIKPALQEIFAPFLNAASQECLVSSCRLPHLKDSQPQAMGFPRQFVLPSVG